MKRTLSLLVLLSLALPVFSGNRIQPKEAAVIAGDFFRNASISAGKMSVVPTNEPKLVLTAEDDAFYIYNREGGGFVIVSGDDAIGPYLGYSCENEFKTEGMPENVRWYLTLLEEEVKFYRENGGSSAVVPVASYIKTGSEKVLETAKWNQTSPYWNLCPTYNGQKCVTGCVATAMAILLRYKQWPEKGTGHLDSYTTRTHSIYVEGYDLGHTYDWSNMPLELTGGESAYQNSQIATLMHDCGVMVQMDYCPDGSGAYSEDILSSLVEHMGYDAANIMRYRMMYTSDEWMAMIRESIDNDCPILYGGQSDEGGHQFIVDGYGGDRYVNINFGWGGSANGMYWLADMGGFSQYNDAIFNLVKDQGNEALVEYLMFLSGKGLSMKTDYYDGEQFNVYASEIDNYGTAEFNGQIAVGLNDEEGNLKEIVSDIENFSGAGFYPYYCCQDLEFKCNSTHITAGQGLQTYYRISPTASWEKVRYDIESGETVGVLYPAGEAPDIAASAVLEFDKTTGVITVTFPEETVVNWYFSGEGNWHEGNSIEIATNSLAAGDYTLTFKAGGSEHTLTIPIDNSLR